VNGFLHFSKERSLASQKGQACLKIMHIFVQQFLSLLLFLVSFQCLCGCIFSFIKFAA
jgi:hypothetical protein